jgi:small-conductance mechanosensitive channel
VTFIAVLEEFGTNCHSNGFEFADQAMTIPLHYAINPYFVIFCETFAKFVTRVRPNNNKPKFEGQHSKSCPSIRHALVRKNGRCDYQHDDIRLNDTQYLGLNSTFSGRYFIVMLKVILLSAIMVSVAVLTNVILSSFMLNVIIMCVVVLNIVYTECLHPDCHYAECCHAGCCCSECLHAVCHNAE